MDYSDNHIKFKRFRQADASKKGHLAKNFDYQTISGDVLQIYNMPIPTPYTEKGVEKYYEFKVQLANRAGIPLTFYEAQIVDMSIRYYVQLAMKNGEIVDSEGLGVTVYMNKNGVKTEEEIPLFVDEYIGIEDFLVEFEKNHQSKVDRILKFFDKLYADKKTEDDEEPEE